LYYIQHYEDKLRKLESKEMEISQRIVNIERVMVLDVVAVDDVLKHIKHRKKT
jgi:hypothetical protein